MTIRSIIELLAQADADLPDNAAGLISPADVRGLIKNLLDTLSPAYGAIQCSGVSKVLSASPVVLSPFTAAVTATAGYYQTNLTNGTITREIGTAGIAGATDFFIADGAVEGPNNDLVTVTLFKNGAPTAYSVSVTCQGTGRPVEWNMAGIVYSAAPGNASFDLRASGDAGSKIFSNLDFLIQAQAVRSFV